MELVIKFENQGYTISTNLPQSQFNHELLQRLFQMSFKQKGFITAVSRFKTSSEMCSFIDKLNVVSSVIL